MAVAFYIFLATASICIAPSICAPNLLIQNPYVAKVSYTPLTPGAKPIRCTGAIYNKMWIVTSSRCAAPALLMAEGKATHDYGDVNFEDDEPLEKGNCKPNDVGKVRYVVDAVIPPELKNSYNKETNTYTNKSADIAMVKLSKPIVYTKTMKPVRIPISAKECDDKEGFFLGFGAKGDTSWAPKFRKVSAITQADDVCVKGDPTYTKDSKICAKFTAPEATCGSDLGGPFIKMLSIKLKQAPIAQIYPMLCGVLPITACESPNKGAGGIEYYTATHGWNKWMIKIAGQQDIVS